MSWPVARTTDDQLFRPARLLLVEEFASQQSSYRLSSLDAVFTWMMEMLTEQPMTLGWKALIWCRYVSPLRAVNAGGLL